MTFRDYIAEEIATDCADGLLTRREALRRLALLGLGAAASSGLLAACARAERRSSPQQSPGASPAASAKPAVATQAITIRGEGGRELRGAWAPAKPERGLVLVVHENRGLTDHIRNVAGRFAADGYSALAPDLLSPEGGTASFDDPAKASAAIGNVPVDRFVSDLRTSVTELVRLAAGRKAGIVGFCFGGGMVWQLLAAGEPRLSAAVPFYGPAPASPDFSRSKAAVLAIYAGLDDRVNASRGAAVAALKQAGLTHEVLTIPEVNHAFFNDTGPRYDARAAAAAYQKTLDWFARHLG